MAGRGELHAGGEGGVKVTISPHILASIENWQKPVCKRCGGRPNNASFNWKLTKSKTGISQLLQDNFHFILQSEDLFRLHHVEITFNLTLFYWPWISCVLVQNQNTTLKKTKEYYECFSTHLTSKIYHNIVSHVCLRLHVELKSPGHFSILKIPNLFHWLTQDL